MLHRTYIYYGKVYKPTLVFNIYTVSISSYYQFIFIYGFFIFKIIIKFYKGILTNVYVLTIYSICFLECV